MVCHRHLFHRGLPHRGDPAHEGVPVHVVLGPLEPLRRGPRALRHRGRLDLRLPGRRRLQPPHHDRRAHLPAPAAHPHPAGPAALPLPPRAAGHDAGHHGRGGRHGVVPAAHRRRAADLGDVHDAPGGPRLLLAGGLLHEPGFQGLVRHGAAGPAHALPARDAGELARRGAGGLRREPSAGDLHRRLHNAHEHHAAEHGGEHRRGERAERGRAGGQEALAGAGRGAEAEAPDPVRQHGHGPGRHPLLGRAAAAGHAAAVLAHDAAGQRPGLPRPDGGEERADRDFDDAGRDAPPLEHLGA
mmetsp:Transcript_48860/g.148171  ORF Transcript_48860/g.148171 Transcript_48860/m.148171 type:complete len:300 (-) Transcript_48860:142-1041(-)